MFNQGERSRDEGINRTLAANAPFVARALATAGQIRDTGKVKKMLDPSSHARRTPIWEWR